MKKKEINQFIQAIMGLGEFPMDDINKALELCDFKDRLMKESKKNSDALSLMASFTKEEDEFRKNPDPKNKEIAISIKEKEKTLREKEMEMGNQEFKIKLPKFEKGDILKPGMPLWQIDVLRVLEKK